MALLVHLKGQHTEISFFYKNILKKSLVAILPPSKGVVKFVQHLCVYQNLLPAFFPSNRLLKINNSCFLTINFLILTHRICIREHSLKVFFLHLWKGTYIKNCLTKGMLHGELQKVT